MSGRSRLAREALRLIRDDRGRTWLSEPRALLLLLALSAVVVVGLAAPFGQDLKTQFAYIPILLATWAFGVSGAMATGIAAAATSPLVGHGSAEWAVAEPVMYIAFASACAWFFRARRTGPSTASGSRSTGDAVSGRERVLESLARTVEVRDHHTQGHCRRVARNAVAVGWALGLSDADVEVLRWAALLHDLGKIAVPDYILLKNGRLSEDEFAEIRRHPSYGADLLTSVSSAFRPIADVVRAHHERWDGLGYPLGLRSDEIPELARIIAVVDVFEALTSDRPYRSPMPGNQALQYVTHGSGTQFDPVVVSAFRSLVEEGSIECAAGLQAASGLESVSQPGHAVQYTG